MKKLFSLLLLFCAIQLAAQTKDPKDTEVWEPEPRVVTPGTMGSPPSDALVLFDGKNFDEWTVEGKDAKPGWLIKDGAMVVEKGTGNIATKRSFGDCQLHIEFRTPAVVEGDGQGRGNSGVFLQSRYEVQVLDSYKNRTYSNGQAGSIYKQSIPLVNACRPPGEWQTYDIFYTAPRFNADGIRVAPGRVTVVHNGVLIQHNVEIQGTSEYIGLPKNIAHGNAPIVLQDHGNPTSYRNIWIRPL